jgi:hypothetical protein
MDSKKAINVGLDHILAEPVAVPLQAFSLLAQYVQEPSFQH